MAQPPTKIYFNGKEYNSIEEVPEEFRHFLKDDNKNGLPDFVENIFGKNLAGAMNNPTVQKFVFKDKIFDKLEQIPPEEQQKVREKMEKLGLSPSSYSSHSLGGAYSPTGGSSQRLIVIFIVMIGILIGLGIALLWFLFGSN